jgi:2'-5' RNA ligase
MGCCGHALAPGLKSLLASRCEAAPVWANGWTPVPVPFDAKSQPAEESHSFSSTQFDLPEDVAKRVRAHAATIPDDHLAEDGREDSPHITIKYGLHTDDPAEVRRVVDSFGPVRVTVGKVSVFPASEALAQRGGAQYDVVKYEVDGEDLHRLNRLLSEALPHTDTHPVYKPHMTLAYVKPGLGEKYAGSGPLTGTFLVFDHFTFSGSDGKRSRIALGGAAAFGVVEGKALDGPASPAMSATDQTSGGSFVPPASFAGRLRRRKGEPVSAIPLQRPAPATSRLWWRKPAAEAPAAVQAKGWNEEDHPRGQPENAGQFGGGGTATKEKPKGKPKVAPETYRDYLHSLPASEFFRRRKLLAKECARNPGGRCAQTLAEWNDVGKERGFQALNPEDVSRLRRKGKPPEPAHHPGSAHGSAVKVKKSKKRAFDGETPVQTQTTLTKQETGRVGEAVVLAYLQSQGFKDARPMNSGKTNFPVDMIEDHAPTEVKAGLVSNTRGAQQWRLTFSKETAAEKEWYAKATPKQRKAWNAEKQKRIRERKEAVIAAIEKQTGVKVKPRTMTLAINPDTRVADVYEFEGFHDRIDWRSEEAKKAYKGSVSYSHA